jgi:hypothetical protein
MIDNLRIKMRTLELQQKNPLYLLRLEQEIIKAWDGSDYLKEELCACMNAKAYLRNKNER